MGNHVSDGQTADARAHEDELLVIRCQLGERPAFDELIQRWAGPLWNYVCGLVNDDSAAEDLTQDIWVRVLRGIARLRDGSKLRAWLFGIARRALMDRLRAQYATPAPTDMDVIDIPAGEPSAALEEQLTTMERELARLPILEREVLTLFYLRELSLGEVAEVLGIPVGTVKSRLYRSRQSLRREIEAKGTQA